MSKSIPALVTPEVLQWARNLDRITIEEISRKMKVASTRIEAWESGKEHPTLVQAKSLAKQYRVPFAYFFLPDTPKKAKRLEKVDYRTIGNWGMAEMSREMRWFLRDVEERRDTMLELYAADDASVTPFEYSLPTTISEEEFACRLRAFLGLTEMVQRKFRKPETALSYCIAQLERKDILVFQAAKIEPEEMRGMSIAYELFPIIALNRKDESSARLFTLFHELVHLISRTSGICNETKLDTKTQHDLELYCNKIAGLALVPTEQLEQNKNISLIKKYGLEDTYVRAIARDFAVSREVILNRLWGLKIITKATYFETLKQYSDEYKAYKKQRKTDGFLPPAMDKGTQVGKLYAKTVLSAYHMDRISPREASRYLLDLRINHFSSVERWCY